jgi:hypothetical protein
MTVPGEVVGRRRDLAKEEESALASEYAYSRIFEQNSILK